MQSEWEIEDWIVDRAEELAAKVSAGQTLPAEETLIRELALLDMESLNGGVSQYFGNHQTLRWNRLKTVAASFSLPNLNELVENIDEVIADSLDPYQELSSREDVEDYYYEHRLSVWQEVKDFVDR